MNDKKDDVGAATLFNNFAMDFRSRVDSLIKSIFLISGGVLSITIGAFISKKPPVITQEVLHSIQCAWFNLSFSIIAALTTMFLLIVAQAQTATKWRVKIETNAEGLQVINNPVWFRVIMWVVGITAFISCITGLIYITYGAGQLLSAKP